MKNFRKSFRMLLAVLLLFAIVVYMQWSPPKHESEQTPEIIRTTTGVIQDHAGSSTSVAPPATSERELSQSNFGTHPLAEFARSDDPFPRDLPMSLYWEAVTEQIREAPPPLKRTGEDIADADEAYRLYVYFRWCANTLRTPEMANEHLGRIVDRTVNAGAKDLESWGEVADTMFDIYEMCAPIPPGVDCQHEAFLWLSQAVRLGHEIAQVTYYSAALETMMHRRPFAKSAYLLLAYPELIEEFKVTSRFALNNAMDKGHPDAHLAMSRALLDGVVFPRDPVMAFAHARAAELAAPPDHRLLLADAIDRQKQNIAGFLNADQLLAAEEAAQELRRNDDG